MTGEPESRNQEIDSESDTVAWLKEKLFDLPGYSQFEAHRRHRIQNLDIVQGWYFAADFHNLYYKKICGTTVSAPLAYIPVYVSN